MTQPLLLHGTCLQSRNTLTIEDMVAEGGKVWARMSLHYRMMPSSISARTIGHTRNIQTRRFHENLRLKLDNRLEDLKGGPNGLPRSHIG